MSIPDRVEFSEIINAVVVISLGVLSVIWINMLLPETPKLYSYRSTLVLVSVVGLTLGLLPWGLLAAETLWVRVFLLYLLAAFITGGTGLNAASVNYMPFFIGGTLTGFGGASTVYLFPSDSDHSLFIPIWLCLISVYLLGFVGLVRALLYAENLFPVLIGIGATVIMIATHQALIRERGRYLSPT